MKQFLNLTGFLVVIVLWIMIIALNACNLPPQISQVKSDDTIENKAQTQRLKVLTTTSIVADVVSEVGDDLIELSVLLPASADPHTFDPNPADLVKVIEADVLFSNGAGLEEFLQNLVESAGVQDKVVAVSEGIELLDTPEVHDLEHAGEVTDRHTSNGDPHTWTDPNNVKIWVKNILQELIELDPDNAAVYTANAEAYQEELDALDAWIQEQVNQIPAGERKLVTDHTLFTYFADEYRFIQIGAVVPGYSSMAEPSAKDLAELEDTIRQLEVKSIFVGNTVNPNLARQVAEDTGISLVYIFTGSLSDPGGEASSYLDYMRYNVNAIVNALSN